MALVHYMISLLLVASLFFGLVLTQEVSHDDVELEGPEVQSDIRGQSRLIAGAVNYLESEKKFSEFERILKGTKDYEGDIAEPTPFEAKSLVTSLIMIRNQVAMFAGRKGREAFESKIRGVAADLYLNLVQVIYPTEGNRKQGFIFKALLDNAASLINWSEQTIHLEWPDNKQLVGTLREANTLVKSLSSKMIEGDQLSDEDKENLKDALVKIESIEAQLSKPTAFKLGDLALIVVSKISDLLKDIITQTDENPVDAITKQVNALGDLLTITWNKDSTFKRILKTMLLGLVRTQVPKMRQFADWLDKMARQAHERLYAGEGFPEQMLYLLE